ncbi:MAG: class II aldolase/adducin family protein [Myxococcota bacterium]|mgnify:CR=1 FL=1
MNEHALRDRLAACARSLHARGFVAYHEGNLTARVAPGRILATPTATSKADVTADSLLVVDDGGRIVAGRGKPFGELGLHLCVYRARPDVRAVVHAHPPTATGFALAGRTLDRPLLPEAVVALGVGVPMVPFAAPGEEAVAALAPFVVAYDAVLLASHGVLAWGPDLDLAMLRMELVEQLARTALVAEQLGGARALGPELVARLLAARAKAGLGAPGAPASGPSSADAPAVPSAAPASAAAPAPAAPRDLARLVADEVRRVLRS